MSADSKVSSFYENGVFQDFYQLLEVDKNATMDDIKSNYRRLCRTYHPDAPTGNEEKMKQLGIAYGILKDQDTKKLYDEYYNCSQKRNASSYCRDTSSHHTNHNQKNVYNWEAEKSKKSNAGKSFYSYHTPHSAFGKSSFGEDVYFSNQTIRDMLKKCGYQGFEIEGFLVWCRIHNIQISTGKELHSKFSSYQLERSGSKNFDAKKENSQSTFDTSYKNVEFFKRNSNQSIIDLMAMRQAIFERMVLENFIKQSYYQTMMYSFYNRSFSNLNVYATPFYSRRIVLHPYVSTTRVIFYSNPKCYTYRMCA